MFPLCALYCVDKHVTKYFLRSCKICCPLVDSGVTKWLFMSVSAQFCWQKGTKLAPSDQAPANKVTCLLTRWKPFGSRTVSVASLIASKGYRGLQKGPLFLCLFCKGSIGLDWCADGIPGRRNSTFTRGLRRRWRMWVHLASYILPPLLYEALKWSPVARSLILHCEVSLHSAVAAATWHCKKRSFTSRNPLVCVLSSVQDELLSTCAFKEMKRHKEQFYLSFLLATVANRCGRFPAHKTRDVFESFADKLNKYGKLVASCYRIDQEKACFGIKNRKI